MPRAFFGPPRQGPVSDGARITLYLVPVLGGKLVAFDLRAREAQGRWLPWTVLDFGANPYVTASELAERWCQGAVSDLSIADVLSIETAGGGWELAIVFRAELTAEPRPQANGAVFVVAPGAIDAIGPFAATDLERWVARRSPGGTGRGATSPGEPRLLF